MIFDIKGVAKLKVVAVPDNKAKTANKAIEYWYKKYKGLFYSRYELQNVEVIDWSEEEWKELMKKD